MHSQQTTSLLNFQHFYLVGIKGVAMTAIAQCLSDVGKEVTGSDLAENFVTRKQLEKIHAKIDTSFDPKLLKNTECVIYTAAHQGPENPQVLAAKEQGLAVYSHAEALGLLFNQKKGVAVCGVGGKSTVSAMITWILTKTAESSKDEPSFAVGVGNIPGIEKTGRWNNENEYFIAEADEYVTDPKAPSKGEEITPRFSYLRPWLTVCTNLQFDHPDVYKNFEHTQKVFATFFDQIKSGGVLVINQDDEVLTRLAQEWTKKTSQLVLSYGKNNQATVKMLSYESQSGSTTTSFEYQNKKYILTLKIPGIFNAMNALAAITACTQIGISVAQSAQVLSSFNSTMRRGEFIGEKNGVLYYDDYAHHPNEVKNIIKAFQEWYSNRRLIIAFQSHTFSRTKKLFPEFVDALGTAKEVVMIDIFPSAREAFDTTVSSDTLCQAISDKYPQVSATNLKSLQNLASYFSTELHSGDVVVTVGAGDIYQVHDLITTN